MRVEMKICDEGAKNFVSKINKLGLLFVSDFSMAMVVDVKAIVILYKLLELFYLAVAKS